jgi:hypothetical protein
MVAINLKKNISIEDQNKQNAERLTGEPDLSNRIEGWWFLVLFHYVIPPAK